MAQSRKPTLEFGARVSGVRARMWDDDSSWKRPPYLKPRETAVGEVRRVFPAAPDVVEIITDAGDLVTIRDAGYTA